MRATLISALADIAAERRKAVLRFLQGLSADELQYLAEFFGSCTLDESELSQQRARLVERLAAFERVKRPRCRSHAVWAADQDHKMILLYEYLGRSGLVGSRRFMHVG